MIHLNIGSNLDSIFGSRFDNISIAVNLLVESKIKIKKVSNFYETPSYPNQKLPKFINIGILANYEKTISELMKTIVLIEKKIGRVKTNKNEPRVIDIDIIDFNGFKTRTYNVVLPHPRSHKNCISILEIDHKWSHPILKKNAQF